MVRSMLRWVVVPAVATAALVVSRDTAHAATATWNVYPGFAVSGIYDYGWHFDESGGPQWGARDYNYASDPGGNVVFSAKLTQNSAYQLRFKYTHFGSCGVKVVLQANFFGWVDVERTEMHFIHLVDRVASGTTSPTIQNNNATVLNYLGHAGLCGTNEYHAHQSADFSGGTRVVGQRFSTDTCWSNTDDFTGTNLYQCPGSFKAHNGQCPGAWNGAYWLVSGTIPQYACELWSNVNQNYASPAFKGTW